MRKFALLVFLSIFLINCKKGEPVPTFNYDVKILLGTGTYTGVGNTITTIVGGKEYYKYDLIALSGSTCELKMYATGSSDYYKIKCVKQ